MIWPIYIPSRGRAGTARLPTLLGNIPHTLVVEPREYKEYRAAYPKSELKALNLDDQGLAYSRNAILEEAHVRHLKRIWMLDDDISEFLQRVNERAVKIPTEQCLIGAQRILETVENWAQGALEYRQVMWTTKKPYQINSHCDVAVALNMVAVRDLFKYDPHVVMKEDRDFTLQLLDAGFNVARVQEYGFAAPANGSNAGGLKPLYDEEGRERMAVDRFVAKWPGVVKAVTKTNGRYDSKIDWKLFR